MWLIVGLGNPGREYEDTRHNVGFRVADRLADRGGISLSDRKFKARLGRGRIANQECLIMKPETYMNLAGESVGPALGFFKLSTSDVIVIHDELDIESGRLKLKKGGGHGGHNGLRSLMQHLPDAEFARVRIGIGRPPPEWDPADYVLARGTKSEQAALDRAVDEAADCVESILRDGLAKAMTAHNRSPDRAGRDGADENAAKKRPKRAAPGDRERSDEERTPGVKGEGNGQHP